jgi:hypothetical protein
MADEYEDGFEISGDERADHYAEGNADDERGDG